MELQAVLVRSACGGVPQGAIISRLHFSDLRNMATFAECGQAVCPKIHRPLVFPVLVNR